MEEIIIQKIAPIVNKINDKEDAKELALGLIRCIRAEAQNLQRTLIEIAKTIEETDKTTLPQKLGDILSQSEKLFNHNKSQVNNLIKEVMGILIRKPSLLDNFGDEFKHIENAWERMTYLWPDPNFTVDTVHVHLTKINPLIDELVYHCAVITMPPRLEDYLQYRTVGQSLNFYKMFEDELKDPPTLALILKYISVQCSGWLSGVIDIESGMIYKISTSIWRRAESFLLISLTALIGGCFVYFLSQLSLYIPDWPIPIDNTPLNLLGFLFILIGGIVHVGVDSLKRARSKNEWMALDEALLWIHAKEARIIIGIFLLWCVLVALMFTTKEVTWQLAFFAGYSSDSFIDLFLKRFTSKVPTATEILEKQKAPL